MRCAIHRLTIDLSHPAKRTTFRLSLRARTQQPFPKSKWMTAISPRNGIDVIGFQCGKGRSKKASIVFFTGDDLRAFCPMPIRFTRVSQVMFWDELPNFVVWTQFFMCPCPLIMTVSGWDFVPALFPRRRPPGRPGQPRGSGHQSPGGHLAHIS